MSIRLICSLLFSALDEVDVPTRKLNADSHKTPVSVTHYFITLYIGSKLNVAIVSGDQAGVVLQISISVFAPVSVPRRPAPLDSEILEKLVVLINTSHFHSNDDPAQKLKKHPYALCRTQTEGAEAQRCIR